MSHDGAEGIERILVGIDGSEGSAAALRWATRLAKSIGAEVIVVYAVKRSTFDAGRIGLPLPILNEAEWREAISEELEHSWCAPLETAGIRHRTVIEDGRAGPVLARVAERERADLIVAGRRGLSGVGELVHGSVTNFLAHHAPCPFVRIPAPPARQPGS